MTAGEDALSLEWHEAGVTMAEVLGRLGGMRAELSREGGEAADESHPHPRNCVLNLVAVVPDGAAAGHVQEVGSALSRQHPLRMLTLELEAADNVDRMDAWVSVQAHAPGAGRSVHAELVRLRATGGPAEQAAALIEPLLVPDVPVYLWWLGTPPAGEPWFRTLLAPADILVVDSAGFERPFLTAIELAAMASRLPGDLVVADLQWGRLEGWRELLAQVFTPVERRPFLQGINGVGVDYAGEGRGNRLAAALLTGWVASRLGWRLVRAAAGAGGIVVAHYEDGGQPVEVQFRSVGGTGLTEGELCAIRVEASGGGATFRAAFERDPDRRARVRTELAIGEAEPLVDWRPMDSPSDARLLVGLADLPRDPVYLRALEAAGELLRAFR